MIEQNYILNLVPNKVPLVVSCSQYDSLSRTINMNIYDGTEVYEIPNGTTATVRGTKQDNTGFEYPCTIEGSTVSFDIQDQMTIFSGRVPSEIRLTNDGEIIGTCNFEFYVEPTPLDPNVTISETDLPLLEEAEQNAIRAEQAASQATTVLASAVKSVNNTLPDANGNVNVSGISIPGGTQGQVLTKLSSAEGDFDWENVDGLPSGGTTGQVLTKVSSADGDANWQNVNGLPSGGTVGQVLTKQSSTDGDATWQTINIPTVDQTYSSVSTNAQSGVAVASAVATAKAEAIAEIKCLVLTSSSFSSLPQAITNANITSDMVVINSVLSNPSAQTGDWTVTTSNGSLSISGSISGSTTITLYLMRGE